MTCLTIEPIGVDVDNIKIIIRENRKNFIRGFGVNPAYLYIGHGIEKMLLAAYAETSNILGFDIGKIETLYGMKVLIVSNDYFHFRVTI